MKLKRQADDFQVEEQISLTPGSGPHGLYQLSKESLGTLEAIAAIARHWKLPREAIAFAGLKDKHAHTRQYITIHHGPRRGLKENHLSLQYVGQVDRPIHASDITGNRFQIVLRDLDRRQADEAVRALLSAEQDGLPNYFDDQRFGSLGASGEFIARPWCLGDYERALWLALAEPQAQAPRLERENREFIADHWGDWARCGERLDHFPGDRVVQFLRHNPGDFRRAITQFPHDLRSLWLAAFQSHLWNLFLGAWIEDQCSPEQLTWQTVGRLRLPFFQDLAASTRATLHQAALPLPSARLHLEAGPIRELYERVLASTGLELRQLRVKYPRDTFFSKGDRQAVVRPLDTIHEVAADELYPSQHKLLLRFELTRGSYATILIKRLTGAARGPSESNHAPPPRQNAMMQDIV